MAGRGHRGMKLEKISLADIDFADESFRISEDLNPDRMAASLRAVGQLNPALLAEAGENPEFRIVCGFRRLHALRSIGGIEADARVLPCKSGNDLEFLLKAVWDNLSHRVLEPLETARALVALKSLGGVEEEVLVRDFLPMFGLSPHRNVLRSFCSLHRLEPGLRRLMREGHLTLAGAERLARAPREVQEGVLPVWSRIRLSASLQREVLELGEDLAALSGTTLAGILNDPAIQAIAGEAWLSPFQRGEQVHRYLYRRRNPRIARAREAFLADKAALQLPGSVRVSPDRFFETPRLRVEFDAASPQAFREAAGALERAGRAAALDRLFDIS